MKQNIFDLVFDPHRNLCKTEKANLTKKVTQGYMNVDWFRQNLFSAVSKGKIIKYKKLKTIYVDRNGETIIQVSHSLHQGHIDVLSILFSDNAKRRDFTLREDGSFYILLNLYGTAEKMGYKYPAKAGNRIKSLINDLRDTDIVITLIDPVSNKKRVITTKMLGKTYFSEEDNSYRVEVDIDSARVLILGIGLKIDSVLTDKIVGLGSPRVKAIVRYMLASTTRKHGVTLDFIFKRYGIGQKVCVGDDIDSETSRKNNISNRKEKSSLRRDLREHKKVLSDLNIVYNEKEEKIYYTQHKKVDFEMGVKPSKIEEMVFKEKGIEAYVGMCINITPSEEVEELAIIKEISEEDEVIHLRALISSSGRYVSVIGLDKKTFIGMLDEPSAK